MKKSIVRLEMIKKKMSALTWCVGIKVLSHCMPARDAQSIRCSLISSKAYRGNFSSWGKQKRGQCQYISTVPEYKKCTSLESLRASYLLV